MALLQVDNLSVAVGQGSNKARIVEDLSFNLQAGQCLGIVGESGSGKSTAAMALMGLLDRRVLDVTGAAVFEGKNLLALSSGQMRDIQGTDIAIIFQDPTSSLNPVLRIGDQIIEAVQAHRKRSKKEARARTIEVLTQVGMPDPDAMMLRYPHQLSGGQRQRVMIAMAIVFNPKILVADEPTTALDLTIQAQILDLLKGLSKDLEMSVVLITHDLGVVAQMCDEVIVLYSGRDVERGNSDQVLERPGHPYTIGLLGAHPAMDSAQSRLVPIPGTPPSIWSRPSGCAFRDRCDRSMEICAAKTPEPHPVSCETHQVACFWKSTTSISKRKA